MPKKQREAEVAYCRRQAARCHRLAQDMMHQNREVAIRLEALAAEFEERASRIEAEGPALNNKPPTT